MSTRGTVFTVIANKYVGIYNHFDSYEDGLGVTLRNNYKSFDDIITLICQGDASCIGPTIDESEFYTSIGEKVNTSIADSIDEFIQKYGQEFNYFFDPETQTWVTL